jgi:hypothetical protein
MQPFNFTSVTNLQNPIGLQSLSREEALQSDIIEIIEKKANVPMIRGMHPGLLKEGSESNCLYQLDQLTRRHTPSEVRYAMNLTQNGSSVAGKAAEHGFLRVLEYAIDNGANLAGNDNLLREVLSHVMLNPQILNLIDTKGGINWTRPVLNGGNDVLTLYYPNAEVVRKCLATNLFDVNRSVSSGTPLYQAICGGYSESARLLLNDPRIDVNKRGQNNELPIEKAMKNVLQFPLYPQCMTVLNDILAHPNLDPDRAFADPSVLRDFKTYAVSNNHALSLQFINKAELKAQLDSQQQQVSSSRSLIDGIGHRIGFDSLAYKRIQALNVRGQQYLTKMLSHSNLNQLDNEEFNTAINGSLASIEKIIANKTINETKSCLNNCSQEHDFLSKLKENQRVEVGQLLDQKFCGKSPYNIEPKTLNNMVREVLQSFGKRSTKHDLAGESQDM